MPDGCVEGRVLTVSRPNADLHPMEWVAAAAVVLTALAGLAGAVVPR